MSLPLAVLLTCATGVAGAGVGTGLLLLLARWLRKIREGVRQ